jgi:hypothetical protein
VRVPENRVLKRIFGPKSDEMTGGWRKLHNEELGHVADMREVRNVYKNLVGKATGKTYA